MPTFAWATSPGHRPPAATHGTPEAAARWYVQRYARLYGLPQAALDTAVVRHVHDTGRGGIVVTLGQDVDGIPVFRSGLKVLMKRDLGLVALAGNLHASAVPLPPGAASPAAGSLRGRAFSGSPAQAVVRALRDAHRIDVKTADLRELGEAKGGYRLFDIAGTDHARQRAGSLRFTQPARVRKVLFPLPDRLVAGYFVELVSGDAGGTSSAAYAWVFGAGDGQMLYRENLAHAAFDYRVWAEEGAITGRSTAPSRISRRTRPGGRRPGRSVHRAEPHLHRWLQHEPRRRGRSVAAGRRDLDPRQQRRRLRGPQRARRVLQRRYRARRSGAGLVRPRL